MASLNGRIRRLEQAAWPGNLSSLTDEQLQAIVDQVASPEERQLLVDLGYPSELDQLTADQLKSLIGDLEGVIVANSPVRRLSCQ